MEDAGFYYTGNIVDNFDCIDRYMLCFDSVSIKGQFQPQQSVLSESTTEKHLFQTIKRTKIFRKWKSLYFFKELHVTAQNVFKSFMVSKMVFKILKAKWLQYRILHKILPVKYFLKKIKILDNDECSFCNSESKTIEHFSPVNFTKVIYQYTIPLLNE
jgi:hypothetical protein